jgi:hypothetical protein
MLSEAPDVMMVPAIGWLHFKERIMIASSGVNAIDALASSSWNPNPHTAASITYSFLTQPPPDATAEDAMGFMPLTSAQMQATRDSLAKWAAVANISFVEVADSGQIQLGTNDQQAGRSSGYSYLPTSAPGSTVGTYLNNQDPDNSIHTPGSYGTTVLVHELGHAIGLKHPGNYNGTSGTEDPPFLPAATDNTDYSIMSYVDGKSYAIDRQNPIGPMLYDILAAQYLYGANTHWHTGNDTYTFANFAAPQCIWDAGGINTFDFSGCTGNAIINLHAGSFSETSPGLNNVSIAFDVLIQGAIGGSGNDAIFGNDGNDNINGGAGDDAITLGNGANVVDGGTGTDTVSFSGKFSDYTIAKITAGFTVQNKAVPGNVDTIKGVEFFRFLDVNLATQSIGVGGNTAPTVAHALLDQYAGVAKAFSLQVPGTTFADPDIGDSLHLSATLANGQALPAWLSFDAASRTFSGTPGARDIGNLTVRVSAADNSNSVVTDDFHISTVVNFGNTFTATAANDVFTGSAALDSAVYSGNIANYTVRVSGSNFIVTDKVGGSVDTLTNIDRLQFSDGNIALDVNGNGGEAYRLYQAAFNRAPDLAGLGYWTSALDSGASLTSVAQQFISSTEFINKYSNLATLQFVQQVYLNVLHRPADPGGAEFFQGNIDAGLSTRAEVVVQFSESVEDKANLLGVIGNGFHYIPWVS